MNIDFWTTHVPERMTTIFTTLPHDAQLVALAVGALFVLSWLYLLLSVRTMKRRTTQIMREVHAAIDRIGGPAMEQQGELIRRIGWAVTYLQHIEEKLDSPSNANMRVASITAQNLVVRHEEGWNGGDTGR